MRLKIYLLAAAAMLLPGRGASQQCTAEDLTKRVAAIREAGQLRPAGSEAVAAVAEYIAEQFELAGLQPFYAGEYVDEFTADPLVGSARKTYRNVAGIVYGTDLTLDGEYIVIGAHYDYNGEHDNVAAVAALLEMAGMVRECSPGRNVIFVAFDGFELGLLGSRMFMDESTVPAENICLVVNLQAIGGLRDTEPVRYYADKVSGKGLDSFLAGTEPGRVNVVKTGYKGRTDTEPFTAAGISTIQISAGDGASDNLIEYGPVAALAESLAGSVCAVANAPFFDRPVVKKDKGPLFEGGITAAAGSSFVRQAEGRVRGKTMFSYGAGLYGQLNLGYIGLRPEVQFVRSGSRYAGGNIHLNSLVVPFNLVVQSPPVLPVAVHLHFGGYYRYTFGGKYAGEDMEFSQSWYRNGAGVQWGIGIRLSHFGIGVNNRYGLTDMLRGGGNKMTERATYCTLSYTF